MQKGILTSADGADVLDRARDRLLGMLDTVQEMFTLSVGLLCGHGARVEEREVIFRMDARVDAAHRRLRRDLITHLAATPSGDAVVCLVLMVAAKDTERVGDYCKNLVELIDLAEKPLSGAKHATALKDTFVDVARLFEPTKQIFRSADQALIDSVRIQSADIEKRCSALIQILAHDSQLSENQAVCLALAFRGCKRISAHLANVARIMSELSEDSIGVEGRLE